MKLIAVQILAHPGDIDTNIARHIDVIHQAATFGGDLIVFPELSLSGYEPSLAQGLAVDPSDDRLDPFQQLSDRYAMLIAVGIPTRGDEGIEISMLVFQPGSARSRYSKQHLHADERSVFTQGTQQLEIKLAGHTVVPAICYESLQPSHADHAAALGAQVYLASVAKSQKGIELAYRHYPLIAEKQSMTVIMANCVGPADNFIGAGQSGVWNRDGVRVGSADAIQEALLMYNTHTGEASIEPLKASIDPKQH